MEKIKAIEYATDLRRLRANSLTAAVMHALGDMLDPDELHPKKRRDAYEKLFELFHGKGVEVITDDDREKAGLPKRGELGWTDAELRALEHTRWMALIKPLELPVMSTGVRRSAALDELGKLDGELMK